MRPASPGEGSTQDPDQLGVGTVEYSEVFILGMVCKAAERKEIGGREIGK